MRTTYIIGAGASKAVWGFPVMKGFLRDWKKETDGPDNEDGRCLESYLRERFGPNPQDANLEDVLSDLDQSIHGLGGVWYGSEGHALRLRALAIQRALIEFIRGRLTLPDTLAEGSIAAYDKVFEGFKSGDTVVTFNYDIGIETYAQRKRDPSNSEDDPFIAMLQGRSGILGDIVTRGQQYGLMAREYASLLLKLHGSVDFRCCGNPACPVRASIYAPSFRSGERGPDAQCKCCGADFETVIIPPTMAKSFERFPKLTLLWRVAEKAIQEAERLVVWGFSCPDSDHHVRWLLRACRGIGGKPPTLKAADVIDPEHERVIDRLRCLVGAEGSATWRGFETHEAYCPPEG
ncbi:MAG TPA: hypothetical protein VM431_14255 [Phycisphaerae bacterium]|nr:hypothetical protein [Phycisphaerae bacterium]